MRVTREQAAAHREKILDVAGTLFRERGFDGIGVADIMKRAGLTHGGFYGHFDSKADLAEEACGVALGRSAGKWEALANGPRKNALAEIVRAYLSPKRRDDPGSGCVLAWLGGEVARRADAVRTTVTEGVRARLGILERVVGGRSEAERREKAIATLSGMVGAMVVARLVNDSPLSDEILTVARSAFGGTQPKSRVRKGD